MIDAQSSWTRRFKSSAAGAPQFLRDTLIGLAKELHLRGTQIFDGDLQDRLAYHLLKRRGYEKFIAGKIMRTEFGRRLAMEWALFPVLAATKGRHRKVARGQSYYSGDALNKSLVSPAKVEAVLNKVKAASLVTISEPSIPSDFQPEIPSPVTAPNPPTSVGEANHALTALIATAVSAAALAVANWASDIWHAIVGALP